TLIHPGASILTVEYKLNLLAPAAGEKVVARGYVVRPGRTLTVCRTEVFSVTGGEEKLCAASLTTMIAVTDRPEVGAE
ncbi:MAG: PaaI family thioesterase, partial [Deltaproteobacteria bacterium]